MTDFTAQELKRRLTTLHPDARRQLAAMTDQTYRGPHNISEREDGPYRLFGVSDWVWWIAAGLAALTWVTML